MTEDNAVQSEIDSRYVMTFFLLLFMQLQFSNFFWIFLSNLQGRSLFRRQPEFVVDKRFVGGKSRYYFRQGGCVYFYPAFVCLSVCLYVCLSVCLSVKEVVFYPAFVCLSVCLFVC